MWGRVGVKAQLGARVGVEAQLGAQSGGRVWVEIKARLKARSRKRVGLRGVECALPT